jgi:hypothetical protein
MPVHVERLPKQPIIITTYTGHVTIGDVQSAFAKSASLVEPGETHLYRIVHMDNIDVGFADVLHFAQVASSDQPGAAHDHRFSVVMVGYDQWTKLYVQFMGQKQFAGVHLPCFVTLDQALAYVQMEVAKS